MLGLGDLAAELLDDPGHLSGQFLDLLGARVLAREKNMLVKRHDGPFLIKRAIRGSRPRAERTVAAISPLRRF
jgi:hypothetical protein